MVHANVYVMAASFPYLYNQAHAPAVGSRPSTLIQKYLCDSLVFGYIKFNLHVSEILLNFVIRHFI